MASGTDASENPPTQLTTLETFTVTNAGQYFIQNLSANQLQVIFQNVGGGNNTIILLASGGSAGSQGADTNPPLLWFTGQISVCGPTGSQFIVRHN